MAKKAPITCDVGLMTLGTDCLRQWIEVAREPVRIPIDVRNVIVLEIFRVIRLWIKLMTGLASLVTYQTEV